MPTFGDLLRHERESRGRTIEDIASTSGIQQGFLEALERNDFDVLPGRAFGKLYLRAYAEILDFDPRPLIDAYDKEQKAAPAAPPLDAPRDKPRPVAEAIAKWRSAKINEGPREEREEVEEEPAVDEIHAEIEPAELQPAAEPEPDAAVATLEAIEATEPIPEPVPPSPTIPDTPATTRPPRWGWAAAGIAAVLLVLAVVFFVPSKEKAKVETLPSAAINPKTVEPSPPRPNPQPPEQPNPALRPAATKPAPQPAQKKEVAAPPGSPTITAFGIGHKVAAGRLQGEGEPFHIGDVASFQTRVIGGRGATIRHVWIYEGRAQQSIRLRVGADDYRTHSNKTLLKAGSWSVEARDEDGTVLARAEIEVGGR